MFQENDAFPFISKLESNWEAIRDEMISLRSAAFIDWPEKSLYGDSGWQTFGLYAFGQKQERNARLCPRTTALVESVPGLVTAGFSRLEPGAHIKPHVGYDEYSRFVLRLHLALETNPQCALRVCNETRTWEEGRAWVFCDAFEHEAWNFGESPRTILLLDFKNPAYRFKILNPGFSPEFVQFVEKVQWPEMGLREKLMWLLWKVAHFGKTLPPAGKSAAGA